MTNHTDTEKKKGSFLKELLQWAAAIALAAAVAIIADNFLIVNAQIPSGSMEDTIMPGDRIIGNRLPIPSLTPSGSMSSSSATLTTRASCSSKGSSGFPERQWRS